MDELGNVERVEQLRRSAAMLPPGTPCLNRDQAVAVYESLIRGAGSSAGIYEAERVTARQRVLRRCTSHPPTSTQDRPWFRTSSRQKDRPTGRPHPTRLLSTGFSVRRQRTTRTSASRAAEVEAPTDRPLAETRPDQHDEVKRRPASRVRVTGSAYVPLSRMVQNPRGGDGKVAPTPPNSGQRSTTTRPTD